MAKIKITREIDLAIDNQIGLLVSKVTCQLFTKGGKFGHEPLGTGVFLQLDADYLLLTAAHVAEHLDDIFILSPDNKFIELFGQAEMTNYNSGPKIDVAYVKLQPELLPLLRQKFKFLTAVDLMLSHELIDATQYSAFGYPSKNLKVEAKNVFTNASYFLLMPAKEKVYTHYRFEKELFYGFEFKGKGMNMRSGEDTKKLGSQVGLSGGGLWITSIRQEPTGYSVDFKLTGIMTDERIGKYHCLIANKIDSVISGIATLDGNNLAKKLIENLQNKVSYKVVHGRGD